MTKMAETEVPDHLIPNYPKCVTDIFQDEFKVLDYKGTDDIVERLRHKVFQIWQLWDRFSKDERLAQVIGNVPDDRNSEEYQAKQILLFTYEQIAYILQTSDLIEEILGKELTEKLKSGQMSKDECIKSSGSK
jgi:hypothetical protein